uniref:Lysophospholipid acyltransferase 5 n=1 Tax=Acrobeloides nanus TaxID=290746 RepID=A0A914C3W8_9BILA
MGLIGALSNATSVREDGLRLLITLLAGYPLAAIYRSFIYNKSVQVKHLFIVLVGIALYLFNCGYAIYHSLLSITLAYIITNYFAGTTLSVALAHICFLGHMLIGYWANETHEYDITWTTPFCIMTLRFIGLVMDVYDGQKPKEKLKSDQLLTAIKDPPSLLETAAYGLFFASTFVGPQFPLSRFRAFINGDYHDEKGEVRHTSLMPSLGRFVAGVTYFTLHQWGTVWVPDSYFNSPEFQVTPFFWKVFWNTIWFRATMYRYAGAFLLTEGSVILSGLAYNGKDENGEDRWDGTRDLHILKFELGHNYQSVIDSFNCGTNTFAKNHIYRRLAWLGNKFASHLTTLFFLAVWHGYHLGYFILFFFEFACVRAQDQLYSLIAKTRGAEELFSQPWTKPFTWLFGRIVINISMAFGFLTFGLVKKEIWIGPLMSMYFYAHIVYFVIWPLLYLVLNSILPKKPKKGEDEKKSR